LEADIGEAAWERFYKSLENAVEEQEKEAASSEID